MLNVKFFLNSLFKLQKVTIKRFLLHSNWRVFYHHLTLSPQTLKRLFVQHAMFPKRSKACEYEARDWLSVAKRLALIILTPHCFGLYKFGIPMASPEQGFISLGKKKRD